MKEIIIAIIGSGAFSALVSGLVALRGTSKKKKKSDDKALQMLLLGEIKRQGKDYLLQGEIDLEDLSAFNELYDVYKEKGGNGYAEAIHKDVNLLPRILQRS